MNKDALIYIAGHQGMVGSAILRKLKSEGHDNFVLRTSSELDLRDQRAVRSFFETEKPEYVFLAAAHAGGIGETARDRADFIYDNIMIEANVIHASYETHVKKLLFLGSSCIYPKSAPQPMDETLLLTGPLDPANEPYAIAKIAGIKMCQAYALQYGCNFVTLMPTNLYGPNDNYDLQNAPLVPSIIRKIYEAKVYSLPSVEVLGSGIPRREFLHVDDLADACVFLMDTYDSPEIINVGVGEDVQIGELATLVQRMISYKGELIFNNRARPEITPRKLLNVSKLNSLGWRPRIKLQDGLRNVIIDYAQKHPQYS